MQGGAGLGAGWAAMQGANCMREQASYTAKLAQQYKQQWDDIETIMTKSQQNGAKNNNVFMDQGTKVIWQFQFCSKKS